ncbi:MAG: hypothetical protein AB1452_11960 [Pseudomonadota bacterium]
MRAERRRWLRGAAAGAAAPLALALASLRAALASGEIEKGVARARGDARISGAPARQGADVRAGDIVTTGPASELVFVAGRDAFLVRANTRVEVQGEKGGLVVSGLRLLTGAMLSVFAPGEAKRLQTQTAIIGIRGTGIYVEIEPSRTYVCTCYGEAEIEAAADPSARETVRTTHHDQPRFVMAKGAPQMLMAAPVINHTDAELTMLEALVGRFPPFAPWPGEDRPLHGY